MTHYATLQLVTLAVISYFCGSIPFGFIIGKTIKRIDLRQHGSGNIGATNAGRVLGHKWGLICLILDALKGLVPVAALPQLLCASFPESSFLDHATILAGIMTIVGHMFPCWLGFRGGKGVATSLGVLLIISPWGVLVAATLFFSCLFATRYVSLSSMIAAIGFGSYELVQLWPTPFSQATWSRAAFAIMVPALIIVQHRSNIRRLWTGQEPPLTRRKESANDSAAETPENTEE